jgi:hypothetical protein
VVILQYSFTGATEEYDGTSWTSNPTSLWQQQETDLAGAGTQTAALAFGGRSGGTTAATEEWTGAGAPLTVTITAS